MAGGGHQPHAPHLSFNCDGSHWAGVGAQRPSNWSTHVVPGTFVLLWAAHWTLGVFGAHIRTSKLTPYRAATTFELALRGWDSLPVEASLKLLFPLVGILTQLWWAHGHWRCVI
jgi:hypothetical protein